MRPLFRSFVVFSLAFLPIFAMAEKDKLMDVEMTWRPTTDLKDLIATNPGALNKTVRIEKFTDGRTTDPKNKIGENQEGSKPKLVTTTSDIMGFVTDNLKNTLKKGGLDVVETGGDFTLTGEVLDFFITETNTYKGNLSVKLQLKKGDKLVWKGVVAGAATRFGRSYKLDNYNEVFSDSIIDFATELMKTPKLREHLE